VPVLITDTAFTAAADPDPVRDTAIELLMAGNLFSVLAARSSGPDTARLPPPRGGFSDLNRALAD
jgi:hypothetical protein